MLFIASGLMASLLAINRSMHMFQLNSYLPLTHLKWLRENASKYWTQVAIFVLIVVNGVLNGFMMTVVTSIVFIIFCFFNMPIRNAKKPLVYTLRVLRMFGTIVFFLLVIGYVAYHLTRPYQFFLIALSYVVAPFIPLLANVINYPIEASVRQYYINDAKRILKSSKATVIGITGSYGKTSVKYYLTTLLKAKYNVLMTPESYNTPMGVVKTIREQLRSTHEIFVCEMGARSKGEIKEICDIVYPTHGLLTSIGEQHLETFKTIDTIIKTKFELVDAVKGKGIALLNGDNAIIRENLPDQKYQTYGSINGVNCFAYDVAVSSKGTSFSVNYNGELLEHLQMPLIGEHNVTNVVGAIAMCKYLGVSTDGIRTQLKKIAAPPHRLQLLRQQGMTIIDDSYNSNPSGCEAALRVLSMFDGFKILITPGMVELGQMQNELNYEFGVKAAAVCDYIILIGEKQTKPIANGVCSTAFDQSNLFVANTFKEGMAKAQGLKVNSEKIILMENDLPDNY